MIRSLALAAALLATTATAAPTAPSFSADRFRAHVATLADDRMQGREAGTTGHDAAARYVTRQFKAIGLKPAGADGGWLQSVTLQQTLRAADAGAVTLSTASGTTRLAHGREAIVGVDPVALDQAVEGPLLFAGFGLVDAKLGLDDYRGLDARGRIVVLLDGAPAGLPAEEAAHLSRDKRLFAAERGAIGILSVASLASERRQTWANALKGISPGPTTWVAPDGRPFVEGNGVRLTASIDAAAAAPLFEGTPRSFAAVRAEADKAGARPAGFALSGRARIESRATARRIRTANVAGLLPGGDPTLAPEIVVLSAHLDHLGVAPSGRDAGDRIYNGALDNAAGVATLLEVARAAARAKVAPKRSLLFLAVSAEEKGLLGAGYFARFPTVDKNAIVADINLDMPMLLYSFTDVAAIGADHSTLGQTVRAAIAPMGVALSPDPFPEQGVFTRSDHYMFVRQGVPSVMLVTGFANGGKQAWDRFFAERYHKVGDDLAQPILWADGARFAELNYRIMRAIADTPERPLWYREDYFGDLFAPAAARAERSAQNPVPPAR